MFDHCSIFSLKEFSDEEVLEILIEADCDVEDIDMDEDITTIVAPASEYQKIKDALLEKDQEIDFIEDEITFLSKMYVTLETEEDISQFQKLLRQLRDLDDFQQLYHNVEGVEEDEE